MNKKTTMYFVLPSIVLLSLVGIFLVISSKTYSVETNVTLSLVNDNYVNIPVNGKKTININVDTDGSILDDNEMSKYSILWNLSDDELSLDSSSTSLSSPGNVVHASNSLVEDAVLTISLFYNNGDDPISSLTVYISVSDIKTVDLSGAIRGNDSSIDLSDGLVELSNPEGYSNGLWYSSSPNILSIENGYAVPRSTGTVELTYNAIDEEGNVVANGFREVTVTDDEGKLDYTLSSLSVSSAVMEPAFTSSNHGYIATLEEDALTFKINAVSNSEHDIIIYDEEDNVYLNDEDISWDKQTSFTICVGDDLSEDNLDCKKTYTLLVTKKVTNYLASLSINSDTLDVNDSSLFVCDDRGDKLSCEMEYAVVAGEDKVVITASTIDGYHFLDEHGPGVYDLVDEENLFALEIVKDDDDKTVAVYAITISVQEVGDDSSVPEYSSEANSSSSSHVDNPGTGDMSSFIIFLIMFASLVASLIVYKKNVESN